MKAETMVETMAATKDWSVELKVVKKDSKVWMTAALMAEMSASMVSTSAEKKAVMWVL